ncbi:sensor histidine kinase [Geomicrobium sp. JCM 19039]|uniref:sensor histidine kinase n=1 Tax=Geomicrobium sp. JCM 19039 TaxID=1460636 RepID=UPI00045F3E37|nr:ATP-binding protein [Geomicrobium sp. JCM 19039]GAK11759.1 two-component sensor histidine kinase [Geomicrobium sp. JCM 19039]
MKKMKIRTRMLLFFTLLSSFLFIIFIIAFASIEVDNTRSEYEQLARQTANTIGYMPAIADAVAIQDQEELEGHIDRIRLQVQQPIVSVVDDEKNVVYHSLDLNAQLSPSDEVYDRTIMFGSYQNNSELDEMSIQIIAPVYQQMADNGERLVGAVSVEYPRETLMSSIADKFIRLGIVALISLAVLGTGVVLFARNIREDTLGMEPVEIASKFTERQAMLESVKEGILAINTDKKITLINPSARLLLHHEEDKILLIEALGLHDVIQKETFVYDEERTFNGYPLIANLRPMYTNKRLVGAICSFRYKTDMRQLQLMMDQMKSYADGLRAQTHEFKNKLYVIMSLLQLEQYDEAIRFVQEEAIVTDQFLPKLNRIEDAGIQAILLASMGKAAEKNIHMVIEDRSSLSPTHIPISSMTIMLGNVIDNAIEAVQDEKQKNIGIFMTDIGDDIIIEIEDSGVGIARDEQHLVVEQGYSRKGSGRGYGLYNVESTLREYNGSLEIANSELGGACVSIILPKKERGIGS